MKRRTFLKGAGATAVATLFPQIQASAGRVAFNDKVNMAIVGCGGMGRAHAYSLARNENCNIVALCDVFKRRYDEVADNVKTITGTRPDTYQDFRHVLDRPDIDAVWVVTPDHWHPMITILGCQAGKDVYVEKPVCTTVTEGRAMVKAARRYGRVCQVGTQHRSMDVFKETMRIVREGELGHITTATAWIGTNGLQGIEEKQTPPEDLDWDMWLGPAPWTEYSPQRQFGFMGYYDYARGGELTNWGVHLMDVLHWGIGQDKPLNVQAVGGSYRAAPHSDNYENIEAIFEYPGCTVTWEQRHVNAYSEKDFGMKFQGTEGRVECHRGVFTVTYKDGRSREKMFPPEQSWANTNHHNNFFHCVRTRQKPAADIEQGFRSTTPTLLAGIALKMGRKLHWNGEAEQFMDDEAANRHLIRAYRAPWHLEA